MEFLIFSKKFFMDETRTIAEKWLVIEFIFLFWALKTQGDSKRKDLMKIPKVIFHIKPIHGMYFFTFSSWMRRYWFYVKNDSKISSNLYVLRPPESEKRVFTKSVSLSVCSRSCAA